MLLRDNLFTEGKGDEPRWNTLNQGKPDKKTRMAPDYLCWFWSVPVKYWEMRVCQEPETRKLFIPSVSMVSGK